MYESRIDGPARGILLAVVLSLPVWVVLGAALRWVVSR